MLYLHIGTGKAGSTTIQDFLGNEVELGFDYKQIAAFGLKNAWKLAAASGTARARHYWVAHRRILSEAEFKKLREQVLGDARKEVEAACCDAFVASSEYIHDQYGRDKEAIGWLRENLEDIFGEVRIILYVREQVSFLKSFYAQRVKGPTRTTESFERFISNLEDHQNFWDYASAIRLWCDAFGEDRVKVVVFDKRNFKEGSLIKDFLYRIDVENVHVNFGAASNTSNKSPTYRQLKYLRLCNMIPTSRLYRLPYKALRRIAFSKLMQLNDTGFPTKYDNLIIDTVSDGNRWVNETVLTDIPLKLPINE